VTREVAYDTLLYQQRRELHQAVGAALERLSPEATMPLAHHFFVAEDWPHALRYQILAGRQSQKLFANFDAIEHYSRALQSANGAGHEDTKGQREEIHLALGELLTTTSQYDAALDHLQQALDLAIALGDGDARARACRWFARLYEQRGEYPLALDWIQRGLAALAGRETADAAEALITAGLIHNRQGDYARALEHCHHALSIAERAGTTNVMARANGLLGILAWRRGDGTQVVPYLQRAIDLYQQAGNIHGQGLIHNVMGNACVDLGQWSDADHHYRRAQEVFHLIGDTYNRALAENNVGTVVRFQGHLDQAQAFFEAAITSLEQLGGSFYQMAIFQYNLGDVFIARGDVATARRHLAISRDYILQAQAKALLPDLHRLLSEAALLAAEFDVAEDGARHSRDVARELGMRGDEGHALRALGEAVAARGETEQAETYLRESAAILREVGQEYGEALSELSLARFLVGQGRPDEARQALDRCVPVFERLGAALDLARARVLRDELAVST
jgi:tetratricopeptide (TPR) repeat protein